MTPHFAARLEVSRVSRIDQTKHARGHYAWVLRFCSKGDRSMANCVICSGKTSLYVEDEPLCPKCAGSSPKDRGKRSEQRVSDADVEGPSVRQLALRSVDEILRIGGHRLASAFLLSVLISLR
jgi:hypothetical protein